MKKANLLLLVLLGALLWSCENDYEIPGDPNIVDALVQRTKPTIEINNYSSFIDASQGVVTRNWIVPPNGTVLNASEGADLSGMNLLHVRFDEVGVFQVGLQATFPDPSMDVDTVFNVTVLDTITAKVGYTFSEADANNGIYTEVPATGLEVEAGSTVYYRDISVGDPDTYVWTLRGATLNAEPDDEADSVISVIYKRLGTYDLEYIARRRFPEGRADTVSLENFMTVVPSTQPVDVVNIAEDGEGVIRMALSRGVKQSTVETAGVESFRLMVDGMEATIQSLVIDNTDESILIITPEENIKNTQTATIEYLAGGGIVSTDEYVLDPFGPLDIELYQPNLAESIDPGFELGSTLLAAPFGPAPTGATIQATTEDAFSGGFSLKVTIPNNGLRNNVFTQSPVIDLPLEAGKKYAVEFKYKQSVSHNGQWTLRLQPGIGWSDGYKVFNGGNDLIADGEWHTRYVELAVRVDTWDDFKMHFQFLGEEDVPITYFFDDFKIFSIDQ
ncbi:hypothetical protein FNH22_16000 [Fulvivirga sp. M361]|uniref:hypothetical protein n=1 Tax=Fulvivirga sp. M361 TaxID=2594266 RepID=UPI00117B789C|nr:hypothetical protein [Fulvivirga sp. M361]TRX57638.1 hypothetical protein FNH22_16000 [Fulvivirga sp. M361]